MSEPVVAVSSIPPEALHAELARVRGDVAACSAGRPPPPGVAVSFRVERDGTVTPDARFGDPDVDTCAARALARMRLPPGRDGAVEVSFPPALGDLGPRASLAVAMDDGGWVDVVAVGPVVDGRRATRLVRYAPDGARRTGPVAVERWLDWGADGLALATRIEPIPGSDRVRLSACEPPATPCELDLVAGTRLPASGGP